jgi:carbon monoxide dehydrogenase subunit G
MILSGTFAFNGPRMTVWELLQDPAVLAKALPGTKTLTQTSEDHYEGVMKVTVGPMTAAEFVVKVELRDKVEPEKFVMHIDGKGGVGFTSGTATIELEELPGPVTVMTYTSDVQIGGRMAGVGQRLLESVSKMMTKQALEALNKELQSRIDAELGSGDPE